VDGAVELLLWQTLLGTCALPGAGAEPITAERLRAYLTKAMREAKSHTTWTDQDPEYEQAVLGLAGRALESPVVRAELETFTQRTLEAQVAVILGQKLVQLTMPGVPDVYQGTEVVDLSLVDPDNRRAVDHRAQADRLERLNGGEAPSGVDDQKLWLTHRALELRRTRPDLFRGREAGYAPIPTTTSHAVAFGRCREQRGIEVVTIVTRLPLGLHRRGGWGQDLIVLPEGRWRDLLRPEQVGGTWEGGSVLLADVLRERPVALLVREDA
jgi:(1->4)-alpha-D-glucan 1-alpha-D-glucosylmutase